MELRRARERGRGRQAIHPLQIPWRGWYDIVWRTYREMQSDRLLSIAGGVSFFVLLAIFPAITALVSAYGLFFSPSTIINNLSLLNEVIPDNVLNIVHEQASRIASNNGSALSIGIVVGILVSLWSAMSGVKAMIDALNIIYEQKETRSFIKLNLVALAFTLAGFAAFLLAIASIIVLPLILSPLGLGSLTETLTRVARWPVLLIVLLIGLAVLYRCGPDRRAARWQWVTVGSIFAAVTWIIASFLFSWYLTSVQRRTFVLTSFSRPMLDRVFHTLQPARWSAETINFAARPATSIASSRVRRRPIYPYSGPPRSSWSSISRPQGRSASQSRSRYSPAPMRSSSEAPPVHHASRRRGSSLAARWRANIQNAEPFALAFNRAVMLLACLPVAAAAYR